MAKITQGIAEKSAQQEPNTVEYMAGDEQVKLTADIVKRFLVSGGGDATNRDIYKFVQFCRYQHLNPFTSEAYLIKYRNQDDATIVVGKDLLLKRAKRHPEFAGLQAGAILRSKEDGKCYDREGTFYDPDAEDLVGGWARIKVKGWSVDFYTSVNIREYIARKSNGEANNQWASRPATMIRKVAIMHALRECFPEDTSGMYVQEELPETQDVRHDESAIIDVEEIDGKAEQEKKTIETREQKKEETPEDVTAALFE